MNNPLPPRKKQYASGPVWCEGRGASAVVSLVTPVAGARRPYIQWCSLVGTSIVCDEGCVCRGANWTEEVVAPDGLSPKTYGPVREVTLQVRETIELRALPLDGWVGWANTFTAGITSATRAWRAAEEARHEAAKIESDTPARRVMVAAEDAAWAAVHAMTGNLSLTLECTLRARESLRSAAAMHPR